MKAIGYYRPLPITDSYALHDLHVPAPEPGPRDVRVAVQAVSVNPVDVKLRASAAPPDGVARILGFDAAGVVEGIGPQVTLFRPGDEVFYAGSIARPGTNSEFHLVDERIVGHKPLSLSFAEAAALPLTSLTAWELLFDRLQLTAARNSAQGTILVVNGAGGVGSMVIQLARRLTGLTIVATASRAESRQWTMEMGAHHVIDHRGPLDAQLEAAGLDGVEYIAALSATDAHFPALSRVIMPQGRIGVIDDPPMLDVVPLKRKSVSLHWESMFTRPVFQTTDMIQQRQILNRVSQLVDSGVLRTTMTSNSGPITAAHLAQAHALVESGRSIGKVVLSGWTEDLS